MFPLLASLYTKCLWAGSVFASIRCDLIPRLFRFPRFSPAKTMSSLSPLSLNTVPIEVLEHIALFSAAESFLGPPSSLPPLLFTCRNINSALSITANPHLYAQIFAYKFDSAPVMRRLGWHGVAATALSSELQRRCTILKRIRRRLDARVPFDLVAASEVGDSLRTVLWTAYLMMLENDGKNEEQLRSYAGIDEWLRLFWFDHRGASLARCAVKLDCWPQNDERNALAMWLFWFLLRTGEFRFARPSSCTCIAVHVTWVGAR